VGYKATPNRSGMYSVHFWLFDRFSLTLSCRQEFYRNPSPSIDEKVPVPVRTVVAPFPMMEKVKRKGKLTINKIPGATQERLWNKKHMIFTREDSDLELDD
jgi:hypothetical protein